MKMSAVYPQSNERGLMMDTAVAKRSMSSDEQDDVAFKVLNQDDLPAIAVVGETIFKPFGTDPKLKPNLIVHPTRRLDTNVEEGKQKQGLKKKKKRLSSSHGQLNHNNSNKGMKLDELRSQVLMGSTTIGPSQARALRLQVDAKFTKTLDAKLRRLQREEQQGSKKTALHLEKARKPFVTTVPKGTFLEPPNELEKWAEKEATQFGRDEPKKLFTYSSQPRVLSRTPAKFVHVQKCAAALAAAQIAGGVVGLRNTEQHFEQLQEQ